MADRVGQHFGNYRLVALLGQGGYAEVYLGQHVRLPLQAAIKVLHAHLTVSEAKHFQHEAQTIARLAHPSIVRVLDYDVQEGVPFLVLDYAPGGSLRQRYPKGSQVPLPQLIAAVKQVAAAMQYAHERKIIHRDVKPENMLLGRLQEVLLSDFGLATLTQSTSSLHRSAQGTAGTIAYMAPEQIEGHPRAASDQYALGVVVYEWLCGARPFEGSLSEVMVQHLSMPPPPLRNRVPTLSAEMEQVVLRALTKDPVERFASVQDFALALEAAYRTEALSGHTVPVLSSVSPAQDQHAIKHNLPAPLTPLIGREREVAQVCELLHRDEVRLVTLTGPGGIGKTRLGVQVATELHPDFADGVCFITLAPISDADLVVPTIAQTLQLKEARGRSFLDLLTAYLQNKRLLLLLDNFEQVLKAASQVADLLAACPRLKVLVTSRFVLHVRGEQEFVIPPLAVPDPKRLPDLAALLQYEAVALFIARVLAVKPDFQVTTANAPAIAEICARLDGLPLAIEIAATRSKLLPPQALLARLAQRLDVLTSGAQDAPTRQQTLRNAIAWSYNLLTAPEQRLFRRLSIFVGGCTLEAVEAVSKARGDVTADVLDLVASLIDKSLVQQRTQRDEEPRLLMLETIREYGLETLETSGEMEVIHQAHARYYLALAEKAELELESPQQDLWLERLEREHDNLRAALWWSLEQEEAEYRMEIALRLSGALRRFWIVHSHWSEGRNFLERALPRSKGVAASVRAKALITAANLANMQDDTDQAEALAEESLALCRELRDTRGIALSLRLLAVAATRKGSLAAAHTLNEEALALFRESGDNEGAALSLFNLAWLSIDQGEYASGRALLEESLKMHREQENKWGIAHSLLGLADVLFESLNDQAIVRALLEESLALFREVGNQVGIASSYLLSGRLALSQGDAALANALAQKSLVLNREIGKPEGIAESLWLLAGVATVQGDHAAARALYEQSLAIAKEWNDKWGIAFALQGLAGVIAAQGEGVGAARLWGAAEALRETINSPIAPVERADYERSVATARAHLGKKPFATAWAEGRTMTPDQALAAQKPKLGLISGGTSSAPSAKVPTQYPHGLTAREVAVLRLVAQGLTNEQVAEQLFLSPRRVNIHLTAIYSKIGVSSRSAATSYAIEHHVV